MTFFDIFIHNTSIFPHNPIAGFFWAISWKSINAPGLLNEIKNYEEVVDSPDSTLPNLNNKIGKINPTSGNVHSNYFHEAMQKLQNQNSKISIIAKTA